jgi:diaminopimelate decarboxylase
VIEREGVAVEYDIVGPVCESGDWLAKARRLTVQQGDTIAILCAGAYGMTMASNYNTRARPAEVLIDKEAMHLIRDRERFEDMIGNERIVK